MAVSNHPNLRTEQLQRRNGKVAARLGVRGSSGRRATPRCRRRPNRRRRRAKLEGWTGEIEGIDLTLKLLAEKKAAAERANRTRPATTMLGMPSTGRHRCS
jgi:hypothetical protein